jgi:hypothetical protein
LLNENEKTRPSLHSFDRNNVELATFSVVARNLNANYLQRKKRVLEITKADGRTEKN